MERENNIEVITIEILGVVVFLTFFFAKIFDKIDWSWWWVFSPLWIPIALVLIIILVGSFLYLISIIYKLIKYTYDKNNN